MKTTILLSVREGVSIKEQGPDQITLEVPFVNTLTSTLTLKQLTTTLLAGIKQLVDRGITEHQLTEQVMEKDGAQGLYKLKHYLSRMAQQALICHTVSVDGEPFATIVPLANGYWFDSDGVKSQARYSASRFAYCRKEGNRFVLETPMGYAQVKLHSKLALALWSDLSQPRSCTELSQLVEGLSEDAVSQFVNLLLAAQLVFAVDETGRLPEETDLALAQWEFHDLLFHSRSRLGRHDNPWGKTHRFEGVIDPLPPVKPAMSEAPIPLYKPDLDQLNQADPPFSRVLEDRKSIREMAESPITEQQLGEFLYRTARVKQIYYDDLGGVTFRPFPGGGALHGLEIYPVIDRCADIPSGLYHYEPLEHQLSKVSDRNHYVDILLDMAWFQIKKASRPPVLFTIAARFQRFQWKYSSMAYALILKDVGCLYQTMYLVAAAMGLAPCALGGGHSDVFALATGLNYYAETSVGGFVLGIPASAA